MLYLHTQIEIQASVHKIWRILTDFSRYAEWNPLITEACGVAKEGALLHVWIRPPKLLNRRACLRLLTCDPGRELRWLGQWGLRGILDGDHRFALEALPGGRVCVTHSETFHGLLLPLIQRPLRRSMLKGFRQLNEALRARAESASVIQTPICPDSF